MSLPSTSSHKKTRAAALRAKQEQDVREQTPATLLELFQLLASRQITGHEAMAVVRNFLGQHGIIEQHEYTLKAADDTNMTSSELFRRLCCVRHRSRSSTGVWIAISRRASGNAFCVKPLVQRRQHSSARKARLTRRTRTNPQTRLI